MTAAAATPPVESAGKGSCLWRADWAGAAAALDERGLWVADGSVDPHDCAALRAEIISLYEAGLLQQSGNVLALRLPDGRRGGRAQRKPHVFEADVLAEAALQRPDVLERCKALRRLLAEEGELRRLLNEAKPELALSRLEQAKVQVNVGSGGAFPYHFDVPAAQSSSRHATAILYLNPEWRSPDGGEIEALPFPFADVAVEPLDGRLVVFSSLGTMHRVRPFSGSSPRVCVNLWFEGAASVPFPRPLPAGPDLDAAVAKVVGILRQHPGELRAFCKMWYRDVIAASFRETFEPSTELDAALALHLEEAGDVEARVAPQTLALLRGALPLRLAVEEPAEAEGLGDLFDFA